MTALQLLKNGRSRTDESAIIDEEFVNAVKATALKKRGSAEKPYYIGTLRFVRDDGTTGANTYFGSAEGQLPEVGDVLRKNPPREGYDEDSYSIE